jgi:putative heme-binding domain-containing protein
MRFSTTLIVISCLSSLGWAQDPAAKEGTGGLAVGSITAPAGFKVDLIYSVPKNTQGSWVCLAVDHKGRLLAGDQDGKIYRISLTNAEPQVEELQVKLTHAQGMVYANNALYVVVNGPNSGLHRLRDTNGDDQYDEETLLRKMSGDGEHGPHQVVLAPDGKSLYVTGGYQAKIPNPERSLVSPVYGEDHLLPRDWDSGGSAKGILAPGGWICQTDFDGKTWTLFAAGFRNQYDVAFSPNGEAFTFDADMEGDIGTPWYRPTRINHAVAGSESGWRSGTGKWPTYYIDSLPAVVNIGPGSPTGVVFGTGAKFPAKYQRACFGLDWTYGTMYAIHLTPNGSSFEGQKETFITGKPLPLTDAVIHPDGAMYFTVGGRKTQSALFRVTYTGPESTAPVGPVAMKKEAKLRHELESLILAPPSNDALEKAWAVLGHNDRFLRFSGRTVIEHQPVATWQQRALEERENPNASLTALCALCRCGDKSLQPQILKALGRVHDLGLREPEALDLFRVYALCFTRMGKPADQELINGILERFEPMYPSPSNGPNRELCEILVFLGSKQVVPKTVDLMMNAKDDAHADSAGEDLLSLNDGYATAFKAVSTSRPNRQQIAYAFVLRNATEGWTDDLRRSYFRWYNSTKKWRGGNSFTGFIRNMRNAALANVPEGLREEMKTITGELLAAAKDLPRAKGPGKPYSLDDILKLADGKLHGRSFDNGKLLYQAGLCSTCHQFAGEGGGVGPDITAVANRYSLKDLVENIIEPSKTISDQYESSLVEKNDGGALVGRVVSDEGGKLGVVENPLDPSKITVVPSDTIKLRSRYPISAMPPALLNSMNPEEVLDLLAYLMSGGDAQSKVFK